jgi:hypothetical protein
MVNGYRHSPGALAVLLAQDPDARPGRESGEPVVLIGEVQAVLTRRASRLVQLEAAGGLWEMVLPDRTADRQGLGELAIAPGSLLTVRGHRRPGTPHELRVTEIRLDGETIRLADHGR